MTTVRADLTGTDDERARGLSLDDVKEAASDALDLFTGVNQDDVAAGRVDLSKLSREDRVQLLIDGETSSVLGSSPWSIGVALDESVSNEIHALKGGALAFGVKAGIVDATQAAIRAVRYALVWDDSVVASQGNLEVAALGQTFLIVGLQDEPTGRKLTLWITDNDLQISLVGQGGKSDVESLRKKLIGDIGASADKDPNIVEQAVNTLTGFIGATQIGGLVVLVVASILLVVLVRSGTVKEAVKLARGAD